MSPSAPVSLVFRKKFGRAVSRFWEGIRKGLVVGWPRATAGSRADAPVVQDI